MNDLLVMEFIDMCSTDQSDHMELIFLLQESIIHVIPQTLTVYRIKTQPENNTNRWAIEPIHSINHQSTED